MPARRQEGFRFDPPRFAATPDLRWVLARAFAPLDLSVPAEGLEAPVRLASALGLAARIAARQEDERVEAEAGVAAAAELHEVRARAAALDLRLDAALAGFDQVANERKVPYALLKGRALVRLGQAPPLGRPAADVDCLVPENRLPELQRALVAAGFRDPGHAGYEHQAPLLRHAGGGAIELHRTIPGVRLDRHRSATFAALDAAGELEALPHESAALAGDVRVPAREVLIAHALVHTLAQHAFAAAHPGFLLIADLIDLGCASVTATLASVGPWIEREVSAQEAAAALELADALAAGDLQFFEAPGSPAARLAAHFVACATDPSYAEALKGRLFERPLSDRPPALARLLLLARTLAPKTGSGALGWLRRPFELGDRWRAARRAGKR